MKPAEIDYQAKGEIYYFDLANGEIYSGQIAVQSCVESSEAHENVRELGPLLRDVSQTTKDASYEKLVTNDWQPEKFIEYGGWLRSVVAPPPEGQKRLTRDILVHANRLGIGPSVFAIQRALGSVASFYQSIGATDSLIKGKADNLSLSDVIDDVRAISGDKRPTLEEYDLKYRNDPTKPSGRVLRERYEQIGGFKKILELAGYFVTRHMSKEDYVTWGVKIMQANNGLVPDQAVADFLSKKRLGPSAKTVGLKFDGLENFQKEVVKAFGVAEKEKLIDNAANLAEVESLLRRHRLPAKLFSGEIANDDSTIEPEPVNKSLSELLEEFSPDEIIKRVAAYRILSIVVPTMTDEKKIEISVWSSDGDRLVASANHKRREAIPPVEFEQAAISLGVFDYLWPLNGHLDVLKLDEDFVAFRQARHQKKSLRKARQVQN